MCLQSAPGIFALLGFLSVDASRNPRVCNCRQGPYWALASHAMHAYQCPQVSCGKWRRRNAHRASFASHLRCSGPCVVFRFNTAVSLGMALISWGRVWVIANVSDPKHLWRCISGSMVVLRPLRDPTPAQHCTCVITAPCHTSSPRPGGRDSFSLSLPEKIVAWGGFSGFQMIVAF